MAGHSLQPRPGFDWLAVSWGGPDEPPADDCSYCDTPIAEDAVPLILWNREGWCARFCYACMETCWGFKCIDVSGLDDDDER